MFAFAATSVTVNDVHMRENTNNAVILTDTHEVYGITMDIL